MYSTLSKETMDSIDRISTFIADLCVKAGVDRPFCNYRKHVFILEFPKKGNSNLIKEIEELGNEVFINKDVETNVFECSVVFNHNNGLNIKPIGG